MSNEQAIENEIQAKGLNAPRLNPAHIDCVISAEYYFTAQQGVFGSFLASDARDGEGGHPALDRITFCVLVLRNGFTVTGESTCVSAENFDAEIGRKIARQNAREKIWQLEGYLLKESLHGSRQPE